MKKTKDPSNGATNGNKEPLIGKEEDYKAEQVIEEENKQGALFKRNPYENSWLLSKILFSWVTPLTWYGRKSRLKVEDLNPPLQKLNPEVLHDNLMKNWEYYRGKSKNAILKAMIVTYRLHFFLAFVINFFQVLLEISVPFMLKEIIEFMQAKKDNKRPLWEGIALIGGYFVIDFLSKSLSQQGNYTQGLLGSRAYTSIVALCYNKVLRCSSATNKSFTQGEIINFIQVDAAKIQYLAWAFPTVSRLPILLCFAVAFLVYYLEYSLLGALGIAVILVVVNFFIAVVRQKIQKAVLKKKDTRMRFTTELINNVKIIKLNSWISYFTDKVTKARSSELYLSFLSVIVATFNVFTMFSLAPGLALASFGVFFATDHTISLANGFACLQVMNSLNMPIRWIPQFIGTFLQFMVSMRRIQKFIDCDEINPNIVEINSKAASEKGLDVLVENASFSWGGKKVEDKNKAAKNSKTPDPKAQVKPKEEKKKMNTAINNDTDELTEDLDDGQASTSDSDNEEKKAFKVDDSIQIKNLNLSIQKGEFICVIGGVGSGKSSLISALLGDMIYMDQETINEYKDKQMDDSIRHEIIEISKKHSSIVKLGGSVSLVQQIPWIQNKTIRDNILFGLPMDEDRYNKTIELCELGSDLEILPGGDLTEIGEKGINLSGGQKARVSLARAVYSNTDILLMDDPVSALDSNVKKSIFENLFCSELKHKTRILVTHAVEFLDKVDRIIIMEKGRVKYFDTYEKLQHSDEIKHIIETLAHVSVKKTTNEETKENEESKEEEKETKDTKVEPVNERKKSFISEKGSKITGNENDEKNEVNWSIYLSFFLSNFTFLFYIFIIPCALASSFSIIQTNIFLGEWIDIENRKNEFFYYFIRVLILSIGGGFFSALVSLLVSSATMRISKILHNNMIDKVANAPINLYFDKTPSGIILNRFSSDINKIDPGNDFGLDGKITWTLGCFSNSAFDIYVAALNSIWVLPTIPVAFLALFLLLRFYIKTFREINRLGMVARSPLMTLLGETINGASTIRTFKLEKNFIKTSYKSLAVITNTNFWRESLRSWFAIRIEIITLFIFGVAAGFLLYYRDSADPVLAGVLFNRFVMFNTFLLIGCQLLSDLEGDLVSYDRCQKMLEIPQEARQHINNPQTKDWPKDGKIEFKDYTLRYRPETELVLKNLSFSVNNKEKIGIVGRTGAGKSTICLALCRIIEAESGSIIINGVDIKYLGLADLREKITIIPQEPTLFEGTLRFNLDPVGSISDAELLKMAKKASLDELINRDEKGLNQEIEDGGKNLSSGEKQLICILRAILRKNKIVLMDEATANIDIKTEQTIQKLIQDEFTDSTVLTIAHRLNTIIHSDKVLVLNQGQVEEYDDPQKLLEDKNSMFYSYAKELKKKEK